MQWITLDQAAERSCELHEAGMPGPDDIALLQYTSGSTSDPKGVMVSHRNLIENLEMIRLTIGNTRRSTFVSWVPLYHDMGLILNVTVALSWLALHTFGAGDLYPAAGDLAARYSQLSSGSGRGALFCV